MLLNKLQILWLTIVVVMTEVYAYTKITGMKALVLYVKNPIPSVTEALDAYGIDYVEWDVSSLGEKETLTPKLFDKRPLYYMIIMDGSLEVYDESENSWKSVLTADQWSELDEYEASHRVRRVVVNQFPKPRSSNTEWGGYEKGQVMTQSIVCADNDITEKIFNEARVRRSAPLTSEGLIHSNVEFSEDDGVIPVLYFKPNDTIIKKTLAAAIFDIGDGREVLTFFIQFTSESITTTILNHLWIAWASRGLIPGYRRVLFTPQIENVFLTTSVIDDSLPITTDFKDALTHKYRATVKDYESIMNFMNNLSKTHSLNYGSLLKMELVFNGKGILDAINDVKSKKNNKRSLNATDKSERDLFIEEINKYWDIRHEKLINDDIFNFFSNLNYRMKFNWVSNTYSNAVLLDASEQEIVDEILKNIESAIHLGLISRHLENSESWWSKGSIGTRGSLGFTDVKVVNILKKYNFLYGLGNRLRSDIVHPTNSYLPWTNILGEFQVIPRNKRLSLRWATNPKEAVWLYNKYHNETTQPLDHIITKTNKIKREKNNKDGKNEAWYNVLESEANEAVLSLLKLKHDPFVFNQSNLKVMSDGSSSIVSEWIDIMLKKLNSYVYWPMFSYKSDDLGTYYKLRSIRKECGSEVHYSHNETHILSIEVSSNQPCVVPITVAGDITQNASSNPGLSFEKVGTDPLTVWITVPGDNTSKIINLNPPLSFFDKTIVHFYGEESFEPDSGVEGDDEEEEEKIEEIKIVEVKKEGDEGEEGDEEEEEILLNDENQEILIAASTKFIKKLQEKSGKKEKENLKEAMEKILNS